MKKSLEERMAERLEARKKNEAAVIKETNKEITIIDKNIIERIEFIENKELNDFLNNKSLELLELQAKSSIALGKIFTEVQEKIEEGTYCKWLEFNGYNRMTAMRHKRRYDLFNKVDENKRTIVALLTFRELEHIYRTDENVYMDLINDGATLEEIKSFIQSEKEGKLPEKVETAYVIEKEIINRAGIFNRITEEALSRLDAEKKLKLENYLKKIEKILG